MAEYQPIDVNRHQVDNLIITCSDFRFQKAFEQARANYEYDLIAVPGPSKKIASKEILPDIKTLHRLHALQAIRIFDHTDCGAFGKLESYDWDEEAESKDHFKYLEAAREVLKIALPDIKVYTHVFGLHGEIKASRSPVVGPSHRFVA